MHITYEMNKHNCQLCKHEFLGRCLKYGEDVSLDNEPCDEYEFAGTEERLHEIESRKLIDKHESFWEKAYSELNIKEALEETFKKIDKEESEDNNG